MKEREALSLGALLHDIGKFMQRALGDKEPIEFTEDDKNNYLETHCKWGEEFVKKYIPKNFQDSLEYILYHHFPKSPLHNIIYLANRISLGLNSHIGDDRIGGIKSLSTDILKEDNNNEIEFYPLSPLKQADRKNFLPKKEISKEDYFYLWNNFIEDLQLLPQFTLFDPYFININFLLKKYLSRVPAYLSEKGCDISLYDHLRTTSAIADSLYLHSLASVAEEEKEEKFLIILGNLSGAHKFIHNINLPIENKVKNINRIQGRSFYISLMLETFSDYIIRELGLKFPSLLFCYDNYFIIIAPNIKGNKGKLAQIREWVNTWLLHNFLGELYLNISVKAETPKRLEISFSEVLNELIKDQMKEKVQNYNGMINDPNEFIFALKDDECTICRRSMDESERTWDKISGQTIKHCIICQEHTEIGEEILRQKKVCQIVAHSQKSALSDCLALFELKNLGSGKNYYVGWSFQEKSIEQAEIIYSINSSDYIGIKNKGYGFKFISNNISALMGNVPMKFEEMANASGAMIQGGEVITSNAPLLGVGILKIENLDYLYLKEDKDSIWSISRFCSFVSQLEIFFNIILKDICSCYPNIFVIHSGIDDIYIAGAWDEVIDASIDIYHDFKSFFSSKNLEFSGAISIQKPEFPISHTFKNLYTLMEYNFYTTLKEKDTQKTDLTKGSLIIFNTKINWEDIGKIISICNKISVNIKKYHFKGFQSYLSYLRKLWFEKEDPTSVLQFIYSTIKNIDKEISTLIISEIPDLIDTNLFPLFINYLSLKTKKIRKVAGGASRVRIRKTGGHIEI